VTDVDDNATPVVVGRVAGRPDTRAAFQANALALADALRAAPWAEVIEDPDVTLAISGIPTAEMNLVVRTALDPATADARIAAVIDIFRRREVPFLWWVFPEPEPEDLVARLVRAGCAEAARVPAMALDLAGWMPPAPPDGVTIELVTGGPLWHETVEVLTTGFEMPESVAGPIEERFGSLLGRPDLRWFAARLDRASGRTHASGVAHGSGGTHEVVACALAVLRDGIVGIYNVATLPSARGRGVGSAITGAAIADGLASGCRLAVLESSPTGYGVYRRLGFETVAEVTMLVGPSVAG